MADVIDFSSRKKVGGGDDPPPSVPENFDAVAAIRELCDTLEKEDVKYDTAVVVIMGSDDASPGFRTAALNCPAHEGIGLLELGKAAILGRLIGA